MKQMKHQFMKHFLRDIRFVSDYEWAEKLFNLCIYPHNEYYEFSFQYYVIPLEMDHVRQLLAYVETRIFDEGKID